MALSRRRLSPLHLDVVVAIGDELDQLAQLGFDADDDMAEVDGRTWEPVRHTIAVWLHEGTLTAPWPVVVGTIAHEAIHVVDYMFESIGEHARTDEIRAYLTGDLVEWLARHVERRRTT